jgi:hypothetical protein
MLSDNNADSAEISPQTWNLILRLQCGNVIIIEFHAVILLSERLQEHGSFNQAEEKAQQTYSPGWYAKTLEVNS